MMPVEEWRSVPGYPRYEVSNHGRVRLVQHQLMRLEHTRLGYQRIRLFQARRISKRFQVHALVMAAFIGPCPPGHERNHKDGNRANNTLENLEYVTSSENNRHAYRVLGKKTQTGSTHGMHILTERDVLAIREAHAAGETGKALAQRFHVTKGSISMIVNRRTWRHI